MNEYFVSFSSKDDILNSVLCYSASANCLQAWHGINFKSMLYSMLLFSLAKKI